MMDISFSNFQMKITALKEAIILRLLHYSWTGLLEEKIKHFNNNTS